LGGAPSLALGSLCQVQDGDDVSYVGAASYGRSLFCSGNQLRPLADAADRIFAASCARLAK